MIKKETFDPTSMFKKYEMATKTPTTFLAMHNLLHEVVNQATTLTVWHRGYSHPFTFTNMRDRYQSELLIEAMNQGILFARKFDQKCDIQQLQGMINKYARKSVCCYIPNNLIQKS